MAVTEQTPVNSYISNGVTTVFAYSFLTLAAADLVVLVDGLTKTLGVDYTVAGLGAGSGGSVTFLAAPANGLPITIYRDSAIERVTDYQDNGDLLADTLNADIDRQVLILQEIFNGSKGAPTSLRVPAGEMVPPISRATDRALKLLGFDASGNPQVVAPNSQDASALALQLVSTTAGNGAVMVGLHDAAGNWNADDIEELAQEIADTSTFVNLFLFFTPAQIADYQARTAQTNYAAALDLSTPVQVAIYTTYAAGRNLFCPAGAAKCVTGLEIPTNSALYEDRGDAWKMVGQGAAQAYVNTTNKGAVFITQTDTPVMRYHQRRASPTSGANFKIEFCRFEQRNAGATSPVVLLDSLCEYGAFTDNQVLQFGVGDGVKVTYQIKGRIENNFILYGGYFSGNTKSAAGIGLNVPSAGDSGLLTIRKNSYRNFFWGEVIGDGSHNPSAALLEQNECSTCTNGTWIRANVSACEIHKNYYEGITGTCVLDEGQSTEVHGCQMYLGFAVGIDGSTLTNYGSNYHDNYIETSGSQPSVLIKVGSGGPKKTVRDNRLLFSTSGGSVPGVVGLQLTGATARIDHSNTYNPRGRWIGGAGTIKIDDTTTAGATGWGTANDLDTEVPALRQGAISLATGTAVLTNSDLVGNKLTVGELSSYQVNGTAATINEISFINNRRGQRILFETTAGNAMVFTNSALMKLAGAASFTGPGIIEFFCSTSGSTVTAKEIGRTVF